MKTPQKQENLTGFTLIELLTVIAIIGILASILIPVVGAVREKAKQAACVSNVRQIALSAHLFASENDGKLPVMAGGSWAWDVEYSTMADLIQVGGGERDMFYCPSSPSELKSEGWDFTVDRENQSGFRFISYVLLFNGTRQVDVKYQNEKVGEPPPQRAGGRSNELVYQNESQRELVVDAVIGTQGNNFTVVGGAPSPHRPNHLEASRPAGGNIAFLDAHVEWRPFTEMTERTSGPVFWW